MDFASYLAAKQKVVGDYIDGLLKTSDDALAPYYEMTRYPLLGRGKYIRPALALMTNELFGGNDADALPQAAALEMVHTYSLVHDDLPAMDNDDLRRGRPTSHVQYGEANAILIGDALLTYAFELASEGTLPAERKIRIVKELARASGIAGMVGGQFLDLTNEGKEIPFGLLKTIHACKTGALLRVACVIGGIAGNAAEDELRALAAYGEMIGVAFQIQDDILDVISSDEEMGKTVGKDAKASKATYVKFFGVEDSIEQADAAAMGAVEALAPFGEKANRLIELARYIVERTT